MAIFGYFLINLMVYNFYIIYKVDIQFRHVYDITKPKPGYFMQQGERHAARLRGDRFYNTGVPCVHGHLSDRYTQSGGCVECLKFTPSAPVKSERAIAIEQGSPTYSTNRPCRHGHVSLRNTKSGACIECTSNVAQTVTLPVIKVRAYHEDRATLAASALMMALVHEPHVTDVDTGKPPTNVAAGTGMYAFKCHAADQDAFRQLAASLVSSRGFNAEGARNAALASVAASMGASDTTPPVNFK